MFQVHQPKAAIVFASFLFACACSAAPASDATAEADAPAASVRDEAASAPAHVATTGTEIELSAVPETASEAAAEAYAMIFSGATTKSVTLDGKSYDLHGVDLTDIGGGVSALFSVGAGEDCGSCSGINAVHYLEDSEQGWMLKSDHLNIGAAGIMGNPASEWAISRLLADNPVLITRGGGVWQGYACDVINLTELAPSGPVNRGTIPFSYSNGGATENAREAIDLNGTLVSGEAGKTFSIRFTGSSSFTQSYELKNGTYELVGTSNLPTC